MTNEEFLKECAEHDYVIRDNVLAFQRGPLSNWYGAYKKQDGGFDYCGTRFNCAEQYMMAMKAATFLDYDMYHRIMEETDPKAQKALGRRVKHFDPAIWDRVRYGIVHIGLRKKFDFNYNRKIAEFLYASGDLILVEAAPWDKIWGCGTGPQDDRTFDPDKWQGQNLLGKMLMDIRTVLHSCAEND